MTWIHTHTGQAFDLLSPRVEDVHIEDIAASLSRIQRYTGHARRRCSVAEHSVRVSDALAAAYPGTAAAWQGLTHDAHEAYIGDWSAPLKRALATLGPCVEYSELERRVWTCVALALGVDPHNWDRVHAADLADLALEAPAVLEWPGARAWDELPAAGPGTVWGWSPGLARTEWLRRVERHAPTEGLRREARAIIDRGLWGASMPRGARIARGASS